MSIFLKFVFCTINNIPKRSYSWPYQYSENEIDEKKDILELNFYYQIQILFQMYKNEIKISETHSV